ncbi:hypothetical protein [Microbacterium suaedae]|uniref:hypothetical protein n=1 Tax=Microbacterium suaedae TaxID=2067813 RepID=UPI000DA1AA0F|nr:hypothetical protein [Microbacterium suaedae]
MPSDTDVDWAGLIKAAVESWLSVPNVSVTERDHEVIVEFDGRPSFRPGRFGTCFSVPSGPDDPLWDRFDDDEHDVDLWVSLAVVVDVMERYEAIENEKIPGPDERGVRWLPEL